MNIPALNLDLLSVGIAVAASLILGSVVFFGNRKSATNKLFLFLTIVNSFWSVFNYLAYHVTNPLITLWIVRLVMFFAVLQAYSFLLLMYTFPKQSFQMPRKMFAAISGLVLVVLVLTLTPYIFSGVEIRLGEVPRPIQAPGIIVFGLVAVSSVVGGIVILARRLFKTSGKERRKFLYLLLGLIIMFLLIITFNFLLVVLFSNSSFIPLSALFTLPFVLFTSYAIVKHELLDIKIIGTEVLTFVIIVVAFVEVILSSTLGEVIFRSGVFIALLVFGVLLIRSVVREVKQREKLQDLTIKLKELDKQKNEFISMAAHELRAPMTAIKGYVSMVTQGDAGEISEKARGFLADANTINDRLIRLVNNMLNVSRIEEGRMVFQLETEELSHVVRAVYSQFIPEAERKGLDYSLKIPKHIRDKVSVDPDRIHEVIANIISNAIKYTDEGSVMVRLVQPNKEFVQFEVEDTGQGISKEEQEKLFQKFYRIETNVGKTTGTGLGLYISRLLVEKFNGKIGLESELGKGSTFWFEVPLAISIPKKN